MAETIYRASHRRAPGSAKKMRVVADLIRGQKVPKARELLRYTPKRGAYYMDRVLQSAIANAESTGEVDVDDLIVHRAWIDEGPSRPGRWKYAAHGRVRRIIKRSSHICVELCEAPEKAEPPKRKSGKAKE